MTEFIVISFISFISIISLGKVINFNQRYDYFISSIILIFISFICLLLNINFLLIFLKVFLIILFFYSLIKKKIKIQNFDYLLLAIFVFLIYFNYNDRFVKTDIISSYGYLTKVIFLNSSFPINDTITNFRGYKVDLLHSIYFNYFLAGSSTFREDVVILSQNLFLVFSSIIILKINDLKGNKNIFNLIKFLLIIYLLIGIFLQNGKNIFAEDFIIFFIFGISIFLIENIKKKNSQILIFILLSFFLIGLGKKSALFLVLFPFAITIFNSNKLVHKLSLSASLILALVISMNFSLNFKIQNEGILEERKLFSTNSISNFKEQYDHDERIKIKLKDFGILFQPNYSYPQYYKKLKMRYYFYKEENDIFTNKIKEMNDQIFRIEIYKASLLPTLRFIINKLDLTYKFPRISINLYYWIIIIVFLSVYVHLNSNKIYKLKFYNLKFLILFFILITLNVILVYEDLFRHNEAIYYETNKYSFKNFFFFRDTSRYLGWSILFSILLIIYLAKKTNKINFSNFLNILLIMLLIISPARSFGYLVKLDNNKKIFENLDKQYEIFSEKFQKSCNKENYVVLYDNDPKKLSFNRFFYTFYENKYFQFDTWEDTNKNNIISNLKNFLENEDYSKIIQCLILPNSSKINNLVEKYSLEKFNVTSNNQTKLDYTVHILFK